MKTIIYILLSVVLISCGTSKTITEQDKQAFQNLQDMVVNKNFEIVSNFARPMPTMALVQVANSNILAPGNTASQINLINNPNHLTIKGDTISAYFPYFGEVRFGGGYSNTNRGGIEFKDVPQDYKMTVNDKKRSVSIDFKIDDKNRTNEHYNVFITLFQNKRSTIQINSTNRTSIEYSGNAQPLATQNVE